MEQIIEFTGSNGSEIASAMVKFMSERRNTVIQIEANEEVSPDLSLDQVYEDGQRSSDRWRVPVGHSINIATGEVLDSDNVVQDYAQLAKEEGQ